jgi:hypothetical protein
MIQPDTTTMQKHPTGTLDLEEWTGAVRSNPSERVVEQGNPSDGSVGGIKDLLRNVMAGRAELMFVEPGVFLKVLSEEVKSGLVKHSSEWGRVIDDPVKKELAKTLDSKGIPVGEQGDRAKMGGGIVWKPI